MLGMLFLLQGVLFSTDPPKKRVGELKIRARARTSGVGASIPFKGRVAWGTLRDSRWQTELEGLEEGSLQGSCADLSPLRSPVGACLILTPIHVAASELLSIGHPLKGKPLGTLRMHLVAAQSVARNVSSDSSASDQKKYVIHRPELKLTQGSKVIATVPRDAKPSDLRAAKKDPLYTLRTGGLDLGHGLGHGLGSAVVRRIQIGMVLQ